MTWVDEARRLKVRTNADTPTDARTARSFGAEGIGLCRTEHMFFEPERILAVREMILARRRGRRGAPRSRRSCRCSAATSSGIFRVMDGLPVTIRLLDPPLHEFLPPPTEAEIEEVAASSAPTPARRSSEGRRGAARVQPDARPPRLPARRSPSPRSTRSRSARSSRPPPRSPQPASRSSPRS